MQLVAEGATISVVEVLEQRYIEPYPVPSYWEATISGRGWGTPKHVDYLSIGMTSGEALVDVTLTRYGDTPDAALKSLFEGMHEAGITL